MSRRDEIDAKVASQELPDPATTGGPQMRLIYWTRYQAMIPVAREHGYALAFHGSGMRDCDLIAVPWVDEVSPPDVLIEALRAAIDGTVINDWGDFEKRTPTSKPHGRRAYSIYLFTENGSRYFDVSVMPTIGGDE